MKFSTWDMEYDTHISVNCAVWNGGGFWYNKCGIDMPTIMYDPLWYCKDDGTWPLMKSARMMVKLQ